MQIGNIYTQEDYELWVQRQEINRLKKQVYSLTKRLEDIETGYESNCACHHCATMRAECNPEKKRLEIKELKKLLIDAEISQIEEVYEDLRTLFIN